MQKGTLSRYRNEAKAFEFTPSTFYQYKKQDIVWKKLWHFLTLIPSLRADVVECEKMMNILKQIILYADSQVLFVNIYYDDEKDKLKVTLTGDMSIHIPSKLFEGIRYANMTFDHDDDNNTLLLSFPTFKTEQM